MSVQTSLVEYTHDGQVMEAYVATPAGKGPFPCVVIFHAWAGRSDHTEEAARVLAEQGYVGFAADVYGKGKLGTTNEENEALMTPLASNRPYLQERLSVCITTAKGLEAVNPAKIAVSGYCFGGLCALDVARIGEDVRGAAAFHAIFAAPGNTDEAKIKTPIIAFHGYDDPMAKPDDMLAFTAEMTGAGADWQLHAYGNTVHAFTHKNANNPDFGTVYSEKADKRSWQAFINFLGEVFV